MKKMLLSFFTLLLFFSLSANAQEKQSSQQKKEVKKETVSADRLKGSQAAQSNKPFNKVCPVSGEELENNDVTYAYNGKTYGLCCKKCLAKFKNDPAKYSVRLNEDGTKFTKK
ncbi:MAG: YHS domain-containing protein [Bacillota bacterium]